jgi:hypothetical protein
LPPESGKKGTIDEKKEKKEDIADWSEECEKEDIAN